MWAEYFELALSDYYMITSQQFPDTKNGNHGNKEYPEGIWSMYHIRRTYGIFYYQNGTEVEVWTGAFSEDRTTNDYTGPDPCNISD